KTWTAVTRAAGSAGPPAPWLRPSPMPDADDFAWRAGGCHCGAVRFEAALTSPALAQSCNCSICEKTGYVHLIVPESRFRITAGSDQLTDYTFNTGVAHHLFCSMCGIKSFYRPRSNPDGWSVNAR